MITPQRLFFAAVWLALVSYAFLGAPAGESEVLAPLMQAQFRDLSPLLVAVFNSMGLLPLVYACFLLPDAHVRSRPAWPFVVAMMALGAFALLPYLIWRSPESTRERQPNWGLAFWESRWLAIALTLALATVIGRGVVAADWAEYLALWQRDRFVHVMTLDFVLLIALLPVVALNDMRQRVRQWPKVVLGMPLVGSLAYLCGRS